MKEGSTDKTSAGAGFEQLVEGYELSPASYELSESAIARYLEAVAGQGGYPSSDFVPPMFVAARSLGVLSGLTRLLAGAIHTSQELEFLKLVPVGTTISCHGRVAQKLQRGGLRLLIIELSTFNQDKEQILAGKTTLVLTG